MALAGSPRWPSAQIEPARGAPQCLAIGLIAGIGQDARMFLT